jgi:ABC-type polysaccharide/polyol phosphate export permease
MENINRWMAPFQQFQILSSLLFLFGFHGPGPLICFINYYFRNYEDIWGSVQPVSHANIQKQTLALLT